MTPVGVLTRIVESSMLAKRIALAVVGLAVVAIVAVKATARRAEPAAVASAAVAPGPATSPALPSVVLVADPREADAQCPCGDIIRRVRAAKAHGVSVEELTPDSPDAARRYGVTVTPTVLFLDASGQVIARLEGESSELLAAISADLAKLEARKQ